MISEEAVDGEESVVVLQEGGSQRLEDGVTPIRGSHGIEGASPNEDKCDVGEDAVAEPSTLEPKLQRAVSSMCASVGMTKTAVKQGGTLRGNQQVEAVAKMNELLQLMVNVQLTPDDYEQVSTL